MARQFSNYGSMGYDPEVEFSGQSRELKALCDNISTNIYTINSATKSLQGAVAALGTNKDTQGLREQVHVWQLSAKEVVKASTADVATLARLSRTCNKPQQLQANKIMGHFKEAVDDYTTVQMTVVQKLKNTLPRQQSVDEEQELSVEEERQQLLLQQNLRLDVDLIVEREMRVKEIEGDITAINQMMCELAAQVKEQSTAVDSIESNVESAMADVESGHGQLASASRMLTKIRKRNLVLFLILVLILSTLIGILVWASK